jgi:hypothetical protein
VVDVQVTGGVTRLVGCATERNEAPLWKWPSQVPSCTGASICGQSATVRLVKSPTRQHRATGPLAERLQALADPRCRRGSVDPSWQYR